MIAEIAVEVHCVEPRWVQLENSKYRIYLNNELLTERDWVWDRHIYINELIVAELAPKEQHIINVEVIKSKPEYLTKLDLRNFYISDVEYTHEIHSDSVSFTIA